MTLRCMRPKGVTLIEIILAVLFLALLFGSANSIMTYSRRETEKGFWIQQAITQLRNSTRAIAAKIKKTSYPSTIIKSLSGDERVISFKEKREYDIGGRLRNIIINPNDSFELHTVISGSGAIKPSFEDQTIMYFPICEPEKDFAGGYTEGSINWVELVLKPAKNFRYSGLGAIHMVERQESYDTRADTIKRAYGLDKSFTQNIAVIRSKELVSDVREIEIDTYDVEELKGIYAAKTAGGSELKSAKLKRTLISMNIACCHPRDKKIWLNDQLSVISNVELVAMPSSSLIELVKIISVGPAGSAQVKVNGVLKLVSVGGMLGAYKVTDVIDNAVVLMLPGSDVERYLTKVEE
ncbi:MAG: hypothetical protein EOM80_08740 [Erysipelotrichia bacterium]|nr:hypothetical protein [Erysipelotrichia bacterium]